MEKKMENDMETGFVWEYIGFRVLRHELGHSALQDLLFQHVTGVTTAP